MFLQNTGGIRMKKKLLLAVITAMLTFAMVACGGKDDKQPSTSPGNQDTKNETSDEAKDNAEKEKIIFWYAHKSEEAKAFEEAIADFNAQSDKYVVEGLSVTDKQKLIVALSGSDAPDVIEVSNQDILAYSSEGMLEDIGKMAEENGYDMSAIYSEQAINSNERDGVIYGVPFAAQIIQMFYNKDILAELGYDAPPETMEQLFEMAVEATEVDENGVITRVGYPLFPLASARQELIYAFGGRWWSEDGLSVTPDNPHILESLNMNLKYREKYGIEKVQEFVATSNTNRYTENDMFFAGKQLFRFDGPWLATMAADWGPDVNFGVSMIPGTEANPELRGVSRYETNSLAIPVVSEHKEGAFEFAKFFTNSETTKKTLMAIGNLPTLLSLYEDADIIGQPGYEAFIDALRTENGIQYPKIKDLAKYTSLIEEHLDYIYNGIKTPEEAMAELAAQAERIE